MNGSGFNTPNKSDTAESYKTFVRQMSDWYNGGELPELAGQDLRFVLELQKHIGVTKRMTRTEKPKYSGFFATLVLSEKLKN